MVKTVNFMSSVFYHNKKYIRLVRQLGAGPEGIQQGRGGLWSADGGEPAFGVFRNVMTLAVS